MPGLADERVASKRTVSTAISKSNASPCRPARYRLKSNPTLQRENARDDMALACGEQGAKARSSALRCHAEFISVSYYGVANSMTAEFRPRNSAQTVALAFC